MTALRNQKINIICIYNIDLTINAGNCLFKKTQIKGIYQVLEMI